MKRTLLTVLVLLFVTMNGLCEDTPTIEWNQHSSVNDMHVNPETGEIKDEWNTILASIDNGYVKERYGVGSWKTLDLGDMGMIRMQLAGYELDTRSDGLGMAATTWIAMDLLNELRPIGDDYLNSVGWQYSVLRRYLQNTVFAQMPSQLRSHLVMVVKQQSYYSDGLLQQTTDERIWIPDQHEVFGYDALYNELFQDKAEFRIKNRQSSPEQWWCRSAPNYYNYYVVREDGTGGFAKANEQFGVAICFCL